MSKFLLCAISMFLFISCFTTKKTANPDFLAEKTLIRMIEKELFFGCDFSKGSDSSISYLSNLSYFLFDKNYPSAEGRAIKFVGSKAFYQRCPLADAKTWIFWNTNLPEKKCDFVQSSMNFKKGKTLTLNL